MAQYTQMYRPLSPCPCCQRHVLASASACPFCGTDTHDVQARSIPKAARKRMSRTAMALLGASLALTACSSNPKSADPPDAPTAQPGPPDDDGAAAAEYGAPDPGGPPDDDGAQVAEYGAPVPAPDDDGGGDRPLYGVPAPRQ